MRHASGSLTMVLCVTLLGCASEPKNKVEGTWKLVAGTAKNADTTIDYASIHFSGMKMFSGNHWMFVGRHVRNNDTIAMYGGGNFTLEGINYLEFPLYHQHKPWVGDTIPWEIRLTNDTLIQNGPRKIGKYQDDSWEQYEVWVRMK